MLAGDSSLGLLHHPHCSPPEAASIGFLSRGKGVILPSSLPSLQHSTGACPLPSSPHQPTGAGHGLFCPQGELPFLCHDLSSSWLHFKAHPKSPLGLLQPSSDHSLKPLLVNSAQSCHKQLSDSRLFTPVPKANVYDNQGKILGSKPYWSCTSFVVKGWTFLSPLSMT